MANRAQAGYIGIIMLLLGVAITAWLMATQLKSVFPASNTQSASSTSETQESPIKAAENVKNLLENQSAAQSKLLNQ